MYPTQEKCANGNACQKQKTQSETLKNGEDTGKTKTKTKLKKSEYHFGKNFRSLGKIKEMFS